MKIRTILGAATLTCCSFFAGTLWAAKPEKPRLESHIWSAAESRVSTGSWGSISIYTEDGQPSAGTSSVLTAELTFLPGQQLQPPHQHADEEFQFVIEGAGTWSLNGQEYPLKAGDLMYSKPMDWHGIRNSGTAPLRFFVFKWKTRSDAE